MSFLVDYSIEEVIKQAAVGTLTITSELQEDGVHVFFISTIKGKRIAYVCPITDLLNLKLEVEKVGLQRVPVPLEHFKNSIEALFEPLLSFFLESAVSAGHVQQGATISLDPSMIFKCSSTGLLTKVLQNVNKKKLPSIYLDTCTSKMRVNIHARRDEPSNSMTVQMVATAALCIRENKDGSNFCPSLSVGGAGDGDDLLAAAAGGGIAVPSPRVLRSGKTLPTAASTPTPRALPLPAAVRAPAPAPTTAEPTMETMPAIAVSTPATLAAATTPAPAPTTAAPAATLAAATTPAPAPTTAAPAATVETAMLAQFQAMEARLAAMQAELLRVVPRTTAQVGLPHVDVPTSAALAAANLVAATEDHAPSNDADDDDDDVEGDSDDDDDNDDDDDDDDDSDANIDDDIKSVGADDAFMSDDSAGPATPPIANNSDDDDDVVCTGSKGKRKARFQDLSSSSDDDDAEPASAAPLDAKKVLPHLTEHFAKKVRKYKATVTAMLALDRSAEAQRKRRKKTSNATKAKRRNLQSLAVIAVSAYMASAQKSEFNRTAYGSEIFRIAKKLGKLDE